MVAVMTAVGVGAVIIASIGFASSYKALQQLAAAKDFGVLSYAFPIGLDAGILVLYGMDLALAWRRIPMPGLRQAGHLLAGATVLFNMAAGGGAGTASAGQALSAGAQRMTEDPLGAGMHGLMPVLFIIIIEALRHLVVRTARIRLGIVSAAIPLHRWLLAPWATPRLYRRMRLWTIPSYSQAVAMEQERRVYRVELEKKYGKAWRKRATAEELLPFDLEQYGMSVEEALAEPARAAERRATVAAAKRRADLNEADARAQEDLETKMKASQRRLAEAALAAKETQEKHHLEAATAVSATQADTVKEGARTESQTHLERQRLDAEKDLKRAEREATHSERLAEAEERALESADLAEAKAREKTALAEAERKRLEGERYRSETALAQTERIRNESLLAEEQQKKERQDAEHTAALAETAQREQDALAATTESLRKAAEDREATQRAELAARIVEDYARLFPKERQERLVARLLLTVQAATGIPAADQPVPVEEIIAAIGGPTPVSKTVAYERHKTALELIATGYTGAETAQLGLPA